MINRLVLGCALAALSWPASAADRAALDSMVSQHAKAHGLPEDLVHRVIQRESGYNPRAANRGNLGLMQIRYETARAMGYAGPAAGLLDAETNLTYAVPYLANAYKVAGGNRDRAVSFYSRGYYYEAKRKGLLPQLRTASAGPVPTEAPAPVEATTLPSWLSKLFTPPQAEASAEAAGQ